MRTRFCWFTVGIAAWSMSVCAEPLSERDHETLSSVIDRYTGRSYRVQWTEYHAIPPEITDEFERAGLGDVLVDPDTERPLYPQYQRTFLSDGRGNRRLRTRNLTLIGPEEQLDEWVILRGRFEATVPPGPDPRAELFEYEAPTTIEERREYWSAGKATYEFMAPLGVYHEMVGLAAHRLLEAEDAEVQPNGSGGTLYTSEFWGASLQIDRVGRVTAVVQSNPGDPAKRPLRRARFRVLEFSDTTSNAQPVMVRKELLWPEESDDWMVNLIAVFQPIERGGATSASDFDWRTFADLAIDTMTGVVTDTAGNSIGTDAPTVFTTEELENMPSNREKIRELERQNMSASPGSSTRIVQTILLAAGGVLALCGGAMLIYRRIAG
ncbi:MAG: hypothetical protein ACF8Q5_09380 [Phycisphaerales bacterium JB040]